MSHRRMGAPHLSVEEAEKISTNDVPLIADRKSVIRNPRRTGRTGKGSAISSFSHNE